MSNIINININKQERYQEIMTRLKKLDEILGCARDENGESLSLRARGDAFSQKLFEKIRAVHPAEWEEHLSLTAEAISLEDALGITNQYMAILEQLDLANEEDDIM